MSNRLEILIEAVDKANAKLDEVNRNINGIASSAKKTSEDNKRSTEAVEKNWLRVSVSIMGVVKAYHLVDNALKQIISVTRQSNHEFDSALKGWENAVQDLYLAIGQKLAPQIILISKFWTDVLNNVSGVNSHLSASQKQLISDLKGTDEALSAIEEKIKSIKDVGGGEPALQLGLPSDTSALEAEQQRLWDQRVALINSLHSIEINEIEVKAQAEVAALTLMQETYIAKEQEKVAQLRMVWSLWNDEKTQMAMAQMQKETEFYTFAIQTQQQAHQSMWAVAGKARDTFASGTSKVLGDLIFQTGQAGESAKQMGMALVQAVLDFVIQKGVSFALSKIFLAGEVKAAQVSGAAVAKAWADAAAMVSLATLGANAIPAGTGITTTVVLARSLAMSGLEEGGDILSRGSVLVGERGPEILDLPAGARVTPLGSQAASGLTINVNIENAQIRSDQDVRDLAEQISIYIAREAER
jgi:hypothetical protein